MDKLGPTGQFPHGNLNESDRGELRIGIAVDHEKRSIILNFGTLVDWLGLTPEIARALGLDLIMKANSLDGGSHVKR